MDKKTYKKVAEYNKTLNVLNSVHDKLEDTIRIDLEDSVSGICYIVSKEKTDIVRDIFLKALQGEITGIHKKIEEL
jgi:VIT1/CCC1 family predicted Fe2+/Mn2+ transporter